MKYSITIMSQQYAAESSTKEQYERYMQKLKKTLDDADQLQDIEARIAELLAEMRVNPGDKVEKQHLKSIFGQLGGPQSFEDKPIVDIARHQRAVLMQVVGVMLGGIALLTTLFTVTSITGRSGNDDFPGTLAEWLYAVAGLATITFFVGLCIAAAVGLIKTRFTEANKRVIRLFVQGFVISFALIFIGALYIAVTN